jgi:hypothetical protein
MEFIMLLPSFLSLAVAMAIGIVTVFYIGTLIWLIPRKGERDEI